MEELERPDAVADRDQRDREVEARGHQLLDVLGRDLVAEEVHADGADHLGRRHSGEAREEARRERLEPLRAPQPAVGGEAGEERVGERDRWRLAAELTKRMGVNRSSQPALAPSTTSLAPAAPTAET